MRRVAVELLPALDGALVQLLAAADHLEVAAVVADVDRQRQAPVALLGDHPVFHVAQPVQLAIKPKAGIQRHRLDDADQPLAQLMHRDEPLVHQAEDQFGAAAPAVRIDMLVRLGLVEIALLA